jgi:hypothetical protein
VLTAGKANGLALAMKDGMSSPAMMTTTLGSLSSTDEGPPRLLVRCVSGRL